MVGTLEKSVEERVVEKVLHKLGKAMGFAWGDLVGRMTREAAEELGVEGDLEPLYRRVLAEGKRWQRAALGELWRILEVSLPPWAEARLEDEKTWEVTTVWFSPGRKWQKAFFRFFWESDALSFRLRRGYCSEKFSLSTWPGGALVETVHGLYARRGYAYWMSAAPEQIREVLREVRSFAPLFAFLDLADLEEALLALEELRDGEARWKAPLRLGPGRGDPAPQRGSLFGDPSSDMAFFLGGSGLSLPGARS
jgi:hypothetical protein